jgi:hypothetical protein
MGWADVTSSMANSPRAATSRAAEIDLTFIMAER